jgi:hypothetical protein
LYNLRVVIRSSGRISLMAAGVYFARFTLTSFAD